MIDKLAAAIAAILLPKIIQTIHQEIAALSAQSFASIFANASKVDQ